MANNIWMIYGTGVTGKLIAEEAVRQGHTPIIAGRTATKVEQLANALGLDFVVVDLNDTDKLTNVIADADLVLHTAGPFGETTTPVIEACIKGATHYLDIANEIPVFQQVQQYNDQAHSQGIALISGVGFGVASNDGLAQYVADQIAEPTSLEIVLHIFSTHASGGTNKTRLEVLRNGGWVRRNGELTPTPLGRHARRFQFPHGEETIISIPSGELEAAFYNTGIKDITVYGTFPVSPTMARLALPAFQKLVANNSIHHFLDRRIAQSSTQPEADVTSTGNSYVWARASNASGDSFSAWQEIGEGYVFTAKVAIQAVQRVLAKNPRGALTPAQTFGQDFALSIDDVRRFTTWNELKGQPSCPDPVR